MSFVLVFQFRHFLRLACFKHVNPHSTILLQGQQYVGKNTWEDTQAHVRGKFVSLLISVVAPSINTSDQHR
jgi:hypothetical protein